MGRSQALTYVVVLWNSELLPRADTTCPHLREAGSPSRVLELWTQHRAQGSCWTTPPLIHSAFTTTTLHAWFCGPRSPAGQGILSSTVLARPSVALPSLTAGLGGRQRELVVSLLLGDSAGKRLGSCTDGLSLEGPAWKQEAVLSLPGKPLTLPSDRLLCPPFLRGPLSANCKPRPGTGWGRDGALLRYEGPSPSSSPGPGAHEQF